MKWSVFVLGFSCLLHVGMTQVPGGKFYFSYPLSIKPKLNANFGEMRPNHFHMGLDLSTESRENLPVYAPADGFVSRMKIETGGFGRAIYLDHPNGTTTLYAHMNAFIPAAELYLEDQQYQRKSWKIDVAVPQGLLPVKKGQFIGYSGNTGASQGPHVHFEIRDTKTENCLNPLLYRFGIPDNIPPDVVRLAFYNREKSIYEQTPALVSLVKKGSVFSPPLPIKLPFNKTFVAIQASDRVTGFPNANGIYAVSLMQGQRVLSSFQLDEIGYDKTRYLNGHIDYAFRSKGGAYLQMVFPPSQFHLPIYENPSGKGHLELSTIPEEFELMVADADGNKTKVQFEAYSSGADQVQKNASLFRMIPGETNIYDDQNVQFVFGENCFYDSFDFTIKTFYINPGDALSSVIQTLPEYIPVHDYFTVNIKPNRPIALINKDRAIIKRTYKSKTEIKKATANREGFSASFRDFGFFQLIQDEEPPVISVLTSNGAVVKNGSKIKIEVSDNLKAIKEFNGYAEGQWLMFKPSGNQFTYTVDEHLTLGEHKLLFVVYDEAGNKTQRELQIKKI